MAMWIKKTESKSFILKIRSLNGGRGVMSRNAEMCVQGNRYDYEDCTSRCSLNQNPRSIAPTFDGNARAPKPSSTSHTHSWSPRCCLEWKNRRTPLKPNESSFMSSLGPQSSTCGGWVRLLHLCLRAHLSTLLSLSDVN